MARREGRDASKRKETRRRNERDSRSDSSLGGSVGDTDHGEDDGVVVVDD